MLSLRTWQNFIVLYLNNNCSVPEHGMFTYAEIQSIHGATASCWEVLGGAASCWEMLLAAGS